MAASFVRIRIRTLCGCRYINRHLFSFGKSLLRWIYEEIAPGNTNIPSIPTRLQHTCSGWSSPDEHLESTLALKNTRQWTSGERDIEQVERGLRSSLMHRASHMIVLVKNELVIRTGVYRYPRSCSLLACP